MDPVLDPVRLRTRVEEETRPKLVAEGISQGSQSAQSLLVDFATGLDFESDDAPVMRFGHQVDFLVIVRSPVSEFAAQCLHGVAKSAE